MRRKRKTSRSDIGEAHGMCEELGRQHRRILRCMEIGMKGQ